MNFRGVIFDMDGTITEPFIDFHAIEVAVGVSGVDLVDYMATVDDTERERIRQILMEFEDAAATKAPIRAGARELLAELHQHGIPVALLSRNTRRSIDILCARLGLSFDVTMSREDGPCKPDPQAVWSICRRWNCAPSEVLMVGDYKYDIECGRAAGCKTVLLVEGDVVPEWGTEADHLIHHLLELRSILGFNPPASRAQGQCSRPTP